MRKFIFNYSNIFFIIAFTLSILSFSIGSTAVISQQIKAKQFDKEKNKIISIQSDKSFTINELLNLLEEDKITITLRKTLNDINAKSNTTYDLITKIKVDSFDPNNDMLTGRYFEKEEFSNHKSLAVSSINFTENNEFLLQSNDIKIPLTIIGVTSRFQKELIVDTTVFFDVVNDKNFTNSSFDIILNGEDNSLNKAITKIERTIKAIDEDAKVNIYSYITDIRDTESANMFKISIIVLIITIINSINISFLWVESQRKDLALRKVCGATNKDIHRLFIMKLTTLSMISFFFTITIHGIISLLTNGILKSMDIRMNLYSTIFSFLLAILISYFTSLPVVKYISKVQPKEVLKEE